MDFNGFPRLSGHQLLSLDGPDAAAFAHAQFSSDVTALPVRHWQWSAWLSAKGRTIAVFQLIRVDEERILLVLADGDADAIASQLQRFVFRRKVKIAVRDDRIVAGSFTAPEAASDAAIAVHGETLELDVGSDALPRTLRIAPLDGSAAADDAGFVLAWRQSDLRYGLPRLAADQREQWTPQQLGLDRLNGYSVKKGCYPGQEIVARTHFLGKAKRGLMLISAAKPIEAGSEVRADDAVLGPVVSASADGTHWSGLAVVPLERDAAASLMVHGHPVTEEPLAEGLAR